MVSEICMQITEKVRTFFQIFVDNLHMYRTISELADTCVMHSGTHILHM